MNRLARFLPIAAVALVAPGFGDSGQAEADAAQQVQPSVLLAAVDHAEAQRRAVTPSHALPAKQAADLDRMAGAAANIDPSQIDPKIALGALAR